MFFGGVLRCFWWFLMGFGAFFGVFFVFLGVLRCF
jgi:hypothetical protein